MATIYTIYLRANWPNFVQKVLLICRNAAVALYQRSVGYVITDKQLGAYLSERRSSSKLGLFTGTALRRVPAYAQVAQLHPC